MVIHWPDKRRKPCVWTLARFFGRSSAANAKNASTPPLDTRNIGFESPMEIGITRGLFPLGFGRTPFPKTVSRPNTEPSSCRQLRDNEKGGIYLQPLGPLMDHVVILSCTASTPS